MCGTVGFVDKRGILGAGEKKRILKRMLARIEHRGRDGSGTFVDGDVAMGNVRLSILDMTDRGAQPFCDEHGQTVASYNGEIYNYRELNRALKKKFNFVSSCDTETLVYAYLEDTDEFLSRIFGMFAFSILDRVRQRVVLAVDRFAIKPLYYIDTEDWFAWSSEAKSLFELPRFKPRLNTAVLREHLIFRYVVGPRTLFESVRRVSPGEVITFDLDTHTLSQRLYWHLQATKTNGDAAELSALLDRSVAEHLLADVPVGLQLSGGVDSSLVAGLASRKTAHLNTYSIGLQDSAWNEFRYSRKVAKEFDTCHHEIVFTEEEFTRLVPVLTYYHDEPLNHSHSVPLHILARHARQDVKVLLSGEGADEVFLGYKRHLQLLRSERLADMEVILSNAFNRVEDVAGVLTGQPNRDEDWVDRWNALGALDDDGARRISRYDILTYLTPLLLRQDKMGMAANVEARVPFLDHRIAEFGYSLPRSRKVGDDTKIIVKEVASDFFSRDFVSRPKCGFGQPISEWLKDRSGLGRYTELFRDGVAPNYICYDTARGLADDHRAGRADHGELLWALLTLEVWMRIFLQGEMQSQVL